MSDNTRRAVISIYYNSESESYELRYDDLKDEECLVILEQCVATVRQTIEENDIF